MPRSRTPGVCLVLLAAYCYAVGSAAGYAASQQGPAANVCAKARNKRGCNQAQPENGCCWASKYNNTGSGKCLAPCASAHSNLSCCPSGCVDLHSDINNCKRCGTVCTGDNPACCSNGCKDLNFNAANCGACGVKCSGLSNKCKDGQCICSKWGAPCGAESDACVSGQCKCGFGPACTSGYKCMGGQCVCGASGAVCGTNADNCFYGQCSCGHNGLCGGKSDTCKAGYCGCGTSRLACGANADACVGGECRCGTGVSCSGKSNKCVNGACVCGATGAACGAEFGDCVNGQCACGSGLCLPGEACTNGQCACGTSGSACGTIADACANGQCMCGSGPACQAGEACFRGACYTAANCQDVTIKPGQTLYFNLEGCPGYNSTLTGDVSVPAQKLLIDRTGLQAADIVTLHAVFDESPAPVQPCWCFDGDRGNYCICCSRYPPEFPSMVSTTPSVWAMSLVKPMTGTGPPTSACTELNSYPTEPTAWLEDASGVKLRGTITAIV